MNKESSGKIGGCTLAQDTCMLQKSYSYIYFRDVQYMYCRNLLVSIQLLEGFQIFIFSFFGSHDHTAFYVNSCLHGWI